MLKLAFRSAAVMFCYARRAAVATILMMLLPALYVPVTLWLTGRLVDSITAFVAGTVALTAVVTWAAALIGVMTLYSFGGFLSGLTDIYCERTLNRQLTSVVLMKFKNLDYACFEDKDCMDSIERMGAEPQLAIYRLYNAVLFSASTLVSLGGTALVFAQVSAWFALGYAVLLAALLWVSFKSIEADRIVWNTDMPNWRRRTYLSALMADKNAVFELKLFGATRYILDKWRRTADDFFGDYKRTKLKYCKFDILSTFMVMAFAAYIIVYMLLSLRGGAVTLGVFIAGITSIGTIITPTVTFGRSFSTVTQESLIMQHFDRFMAMPASSEARGVRSEDVFDDLCLDKQNVTVSLDNVWFTYPHTDTPILRGVSFDIRAGERVALVGENGAGKSTLIKLLCGLYKPDSGTITVSYSDNSTQTSTHTTTQPRQHEPPQALPLDTLTATERQRLFGVVFQDYVSYELTLRENVAFGSIAKLHDDDALHDALRRGLWSESLPLDANLGKIEDDGVDLSGGQWQRLAVSRALASDAAFIILDEPTAALDPIAESRMYETFQSALNDRGCVMISHRLASARLADKIVVLDKGSVVQSGTHDELMAVDGLYREMYTAQSSWYSESEVSQ
jgi:ABC-type multidrug transport system fused ATPase/permease subunit